MNPPSAGPPMIATLSSRGGQRKCARQLFGGTSAGTIACCEGICSARATPSSTLAPKIRSRPNASPRRRPHQRDRHQRLQHQRGGKDAAAVHAIHQLPGRQRQQQRRQELHQADHAEVPGAPRQVVHLPGQRHQQHLVRRGAEQPRPQEAAEACRQRCFARGSHSNDGYGEVGTSDHRTGGKAAGSVAGERHGNLTRAPLDDRVGNANGRGI